MTARWKIVAIGALVPALVTGGIALAERSDSDGQGDRGERRAQERHGHRGGPPGLGLLRNLTYAELHVREDGKDKVLRVDKGRLRSASETSITIEENDGKTVAVAVDEGTRVLPRRFGGGGGGVSVTDLKRGRMVIAVHEGDKPARLVAAPLRKRWRRHLRMGGDPHMGFHDRERR